jgi:hypothetical protein
MFDILFGADWKQIGVASAEIDTVEGLAETLGKDVSEVYFGNFRIVGKRFVSSNKGAFYTYWSKVGPLNIATIVLLSSVADESIYFFKRNGEMEAFTDFDEAIQVGYLPDECVEQKSLASAVIAVATRGDDEFARAAERLLEPYMTQDD